MDEDRIRWLNARLPKTRVIGQGVIRDEGGRVLLCELTYKKAWDLPGGVVEPGESPRSGCLREVREELGVILTDVGLLAANWLPPWSGWDDAVTFLFDLGTQPACFTDTLRLEPHEIRAVHWVEPAEIPAVAPAATAQVLATVLSGGDRRAAPLYLEAGVAALPR